ncbi:MAG: adenylate kinase family protein [Candidatus Bathyarchaeota archaeon]|nr:adenylate kinase family protein [Candidatus Bathyarchaeota archaeon]
MNRRVIVVTGTPAVGKTTLSKQLAEDLSARYVNLTELAKSERLLVGKDPDRDTQIIDEDKVRQKLAQLLQQTPNADFIVDGHYAAAVTPPDAVTQVLVLRRHPKELHAQMQQKGFSTQKIQENLTAEILDACLVEALAHQSKEKICELDLTGKNVEQSLKAVHDVLAGKAPCVVGMIDWIAVLEKEGVVDEYLRF